MKRKKIFYVPGMISLLGCCAFSLFLHPNLAEPQRQYVKRLNLPYDGPAKNLLRFSSQTFLKEIKRKKHIDFDLNDSTHLHPFDLFQRKLAFITREIEGLQFTHDTNTVIKVTLGESNTYGHFIWLLDQATIYHLKRYALIGNSVYFLGNPPPDTSIIYIQPLSL